MSGWQEGVILVPCDWNAIKKNGYDIPKQFKKETRPVVVTYSHKLGFSLMKLAKKFDILVVPSAPDKLYLLPPQVL